MPSSAHPNDTPAGALASVEAARLVKDFGFKASARLKKLLVYLCDRAEKPLDPPVTQVEIAKDVLGLNEDFDPVSDAHVRIEIGRLRTALALYYAQSTSHSDFQIKIAKGGYVPVLERVSQSPPSVSLTKTETTQRARPLEANARSISLVARIGVNNWGQSNINFQSKGAEANGG